MEDRLKHSTPDLGCSRYHSSFVSAAGALCIVMDYYKGGGLNKSMSALLYDRAGSGRLICGTAISNLQVICSSASSTVLTTYPSSATSRRRYGMGGLTTH